MKFAPNLCFFQELSIRVRLETMLFSRSKNIPSKNTQPFTPLNCRRSVSDALILGILGDHEFTIINGAGKVKRWDDMNS